MTLREFVAGLMLATDRAGIIGPAAVALSLIVVGILLVLRSRRP